MHKLLTEKPRVQNGLDFSQSVVIIQQRNRSFYQSIHRIAEKTFNELYLKYLKEGHPAVSYGTFLP